jgi:hypothetical protein
VCETPAGRVIVVRVIIVNIDKSCQVEIGEGEAVDIEFNGGES